MFHFRIGERKYNGFMVDQYSGKSIDELLKTKPNKSNAYIFRFSKKAVINIPIYRWSVKLKKWIKLSRALN